MGRYEKDDFFRVPTEHAETSQGAVELPILYYDTSNVVAFFVSPKAAVSQLLEGTGLKPALSFGPWSVIALSFYEYRKTTVGVYNEVGVAIPVVHKNIPTPLGGLTDLFRPLNQRDLGFYVVDLPVTTDVANAAGRELWGYPKFVTDIVFSLDAKQFHGKVLDPTERKMIVSLEGGLGIGVRASPISPITYSKLAQQWLKTTVNVRGPVQLGWSPSMRLTVGTSSHPMAERLRGLGLNRARPLCLMSTHLFQSRLNKGAPCF